MVLCEQGRIDKLEEIILETRSRKECHGALRVLLRRSS